MKSFRVVLVILSVVLAFPVFGSRPSGFFLPDSVREVTLQYRTVRGLILLPVRINDSITVNVVVDTGCRNMILFGKQFADLFTFAPAKPVVFSGLGAGPPVTGRVALGNRVVMNEVVGESIPIVVTDRKRVFNRHRDVHGVVGYELFLKFEIELNAAARTITFRKARQGAPAGFHVVPLRVSDARPLIRSSVVVHGQRYEFDLMIDTGSVLGLLVKTTEMAAFPTLREEAVLGEGLNGRISGYKTVCDRVELPGFTFSSVPAGIVSSLWHNNATLGMAVLKDYVVVINYAGGYVGFLPHPR